MLSTVAWLVGFSPWNIDISFYSIRKLCCASNWLLPSLKLTVIPSINPNKHQARAWKMKTFWPGTGGRSRLRRSSLPGNASARSLCPPSPLWNWKMKLYFFNIIACLWTSKGFIFDIHIFYWIFMELASTSLFPDFGDCTFLRQDLLTATALGPTRKKDYYHHYSDEKKLKIRNTATRI